MGAALSRRNALAAVISQHEGYLVKHRGERDSLFAVFARAEDHPLSPLLEVVGALIEKSEDEHVPELTEA